MAITLATIAEHLGAQLYGDEHCQIERIMPLDKAQAGSITFLTNPKYRTELVSCGASAILLHPNELEFCQQNTNIHALVLKNPYLGYAKLAQLMDTTPKAAVGIAASAVIDASAVVPASASVGANAVISAGVILGENVQVGAGCFVGANSEIGDDTLLWAGVTVYHNVKIGKNGCFQSGAVIGSDGFGYASDQGQWVKIPQLGGVTIGDNVEVGANSTIDRGALDDTIIEDGVVIDNQCQVAHNVIIGKNTAFAGGAMVAGSTHIGANCIVGGKTGIAGHLTIVDNVVLTANGMVIKDITEAGMYSGGLPTLANREWRKMNVRVRQLEDIVKRLRVAEKAIEHLTDVQTGEKTNKPA